MFLERHPASTDEIKAITARVERDHKLLKVAFVLEAELSRIAVPAAGPARRGDKLWQHTCFEIFVSSGMPAYREFNFAPSGEWAAYAFSEYRKPLAVSIKEPLLSIRRGSDKLELDATLSVVEDAKVSIAVSAVVENKSGTLSYWALKHPAGKPDFHHPDAFVLEL